MVRTLNRRQFVGTAAGAAAGLSLGLPNLGTRSALAATEINWAVNAWAPTETSLVEKVVANLMAMNPELKVDVLGYDPNTYDQKLLADIVAGTLPDIFVSADVYTKPFFDANLTADLKPFMDKTGPKIEEFDEKFIALAQYDGKVGFLPRAADVVVLYYNKRMFDEAGVAYPTEDWTLDDQMSAAEKLTKKASDGTTTQYGLTANYTWWAYWVPLVVAQGGQILSEDNTKAVFNSPEGISAWDFIFSGLKNGFFVPYSVQQSMGGDSVPFANGTAAMIPTIRGLTPSFREQLKDDWDVTLVPKGKVDRKTGMGTMGYAMSSQTKNPEAAWEVLNYTFTEGMKVFMETYLLIPPIKSFYDDPTWRNLPGPPYSNDIFVTAMDTAMLPPSLPFYSTGPFNQAMKDGLDAVVLGQMTTEEAVNRMAEEATNALKS
ncbi:MAG: multiple sugar transport system substrate-binding protein [Thermomicrobiales bacterium]|jgi:multiple sugar transport system substrate-binding protein|nr:multiple sugar transport system substrate-binding protein [Thermomicrobiales bacterium]MEA2524555.1 multiple sugar transport system substrate-binding protein [Thermomicrobiales bacterium]MEA2593581.1 multiple sugar transport system substrate-binding protein [Thermomicrobiales bacterium]